MLLDVAQFRPDLGRERQVGRGLSRVGAADRVATPKAPLTGFGRPPQFAGGDRERTSPLLNEGTYDITTAKAYRLLRAVKNTTVDDGLIKRNPCRIKGAGQEKSAERPVLTITQVYAVAAAVAPHYRALILLAAFSSLRWSELAARCPALMSSPRGPAATDCAPALSTAFRTTTPC